ncbi:hypothetical protein CPK_ORF01009 [Chlamydia pneumoniae LPCoLN]|uniref:Uncharacterized protein n=1 Tax=Chlamydia pneumoniae TaxID=83558 RepID=A0A0F7X1Z8_CHLPN|nr:hypothetical protein CPK_ORF01009 [Chlamydia pneumoniae LPCoLN]CRI42607.1 Uncharacterized protein BN1224_DC9_BS_00900 [Chlamydia pneumoniae]
MFPSRISVENPLVFSLWIPSFLPQRPKTLNPLNEEKEGSQL